MITANEARLETEEYLKGRVKINKVLDFIDDAIRIACHNGEDHVFVEANSFYNPLLSEAQMEVVINELVDLGYKVAPVYEEHTEIRMTSKVGYNIEW